MEEKTTTEVVQPIPVTMISGTGDGSMKHNTLAETPGTQPNVYINVVTPLVALAVRFGHSFVITFVGLLPVAGVAAQANIFTASTAELAIASFSVASVDFLRNLATILLRLEGRYPLLTGSV